MTKMTDMQELKKDLKEVVGKVNRIEQHLSDMNGKLISLNEHTYSKCPSFRKEIYEEIKHENRIQNRLIWITMGGISVIIFILGVVTPKLIELTWS